MFWYKKYIIKNRIIVGKRNENLYINSVVYYCKKISNKFLYLLYNNIKNISYIYERIHIYDLI